MKFGMGQAVPRVEDPRLLRGGGRYTDDINLSGQTRAYILRSPIAHARIASIDTSAAEAAPGVLAVLTGADWAADGHGGLPCLVSSLLPLERPDGTPMYDPERPALLADKVRFVGDYVAMVVAETLNQARDAAELIDVDYDELPAVTDPAKAVEPGAAAVWDDCPDNIAFCREMGDQGAVEAAFADAAHVAKLDIYMSRVAQNPMEPRAALGEWDKFTERYTLWGGTQGPHDTRRFLATQVFHVPERQIRVVANDMGGGFGLRGGIFPEQALVLWAARKVGRPVKWNGDRSEAFVSDDHGRDSRLTVELALNADNDFTGLRVTSKASLGAYLTLFGPFPTFGNMGSVIGVYKTPCAYVNVTAAFTNCVPIGPYRGAGRPESATMMEMVIDQAAKDLGIDRVDLRRHNIIPEDAMPFQTGLVFNYDSGKFEDNMNKAMANADVAGFAARKAESEANGKLRGLGIANAIEQSAGLFDEGAEISFDPDGGATVKLGTHNHGQGHETVFKQLLADRLGLEFEQIRYVQGDTDQVPYGHGTFGSRSSGLGGGALAKAADKIIEKGKIIAAHHFETDAGDIEFDDATFTVAGTDRTVNLTDVARMAHAPALQPPGMDGGLAAFATHKPTAPTFPNGTHVCEVEIDPDTGVMRIERYHVVGDVGTVMNPLLLAGQIQGGVAQGIGQIICEEIVWADDGQLITGSFMDYCMPKADQIPMIEVESNPSPTPSNPLGIKGAGEAGAVGGMPCVMNAITDAIGKPVTMPATPETIWRAING